MRSRRRRPLAAPQRLDAAPACLRHPHHPHHPAPHRREALRLALRPCAGCRCGTSTPGELAFFFQLSSLSSSALVRPELAPSKLTLHAQMHTPWTSTVLAEMMHQCKRGKRTVYQLAVHLE